MKWLVLLLPGGSVIAAVLGLVWLLRRRRQASVDAELEALIDRKGVRVMEIVRHQDGEALRQIAERRRDHAEARRLEARRIESGAESPERLRLIKTSGR